MTDLDFMALLAFWAAYSLWRLSAHSKRSADALEALRDAAQVRR